jgi:hypothetical protein
VTAPTEPVPAAKLVNISGKFAYVECCWCGGIHAHALTLLGSAEVVAHCSPSGELRTYSMPARPQKTGTH